MSDAEPSALDPDLPDWTPITPVFDPLRAMVARQGGSFRELPHHILTFLPGHGEAARRLVVTWENLAAPGQKSTRVPWGYALLERQGWSVLGVMIKRKDFYRDASLFAALEGMRDAGFFAQFAQVSMYGSSMGGFGGLTFAGMAPGCTVVAFAPQSTLRRDLAPFERRYRYASRAFDWSGPYADACEGLASVGRAYVFYDPQVDEDRRHVARLLAADRRGVIVPLRCHWMTHKLPPLMLRMGIMKDLAVAALTGTLTPAQFYRLARARMQNRGCIDRMLGQAMSRGHYRLGLAAAERAMAEAPAWQHRHRIRAFRAALAGAPPAAATDAEAEAGDDADAGWPPVAGDGTGRK